MEKLKSFVILAGFLLLISASISSAAYTAWQNEYDGSGANALYLWNFNTDEIVSGNSAKNIVTGYSPRAINYGSVTYTGATGGKFEQGVHLPGGSGSGDFIYPYPALTDLFSGVTDPSFTVETWLKFDDISQATQWIADKQYVNKDGFQLRFYNDAWGKRFVFTLGDGSTTINVVGKVPDIVAGEWYHLAATWDAASDTAKIFLNGEELGSTTSAGMIYQENARYLKIGNRQGSSYGVFNGTLDCFRISNIAYDFAPVPEPTTALLVCIGLPILAKVKKQTK